MTLPGTAPAAAEVVPALEEPPQAPPRSPRLTPWGYARYAWAQLTSMRTALVLLFLVALAAVPGSLLPQRGADPLRVRDFYRAHPALAPVVDRLSGFDVYASPWFAATYLLLLVSLAGCVLPRAWRHGRASLARPPATPRRLERLRHHAVLATSSAPDAAADAVRDVLRRRRFRVDTGTEADGARAVAAEKGFLRETGNLLFHVAMLALLVGVALGSAYGWKGTKLLVRGDTLLDVRGAYDDFTAGRSVDPRALQPFQVRLDGFRARYVESGEKAGTAAGFDARVAFSPDPSSPLRAADVSPNHPLVIGQTKVYLLGNGYAPRVVVRDRTGRVVHDRAVPFLPQDSNLSSEGVVKVTAEPAPHQLGLQGLFTPTTRVLRGDLAVSTFPGARDPALSLTAFSGDLGLDRGGEQSVYALDLRGMSKVDRFLLRPGQSHRIAATGDTVTFAGWEPWTNLQATHDPGKRVVLGAAVLVLAGLLLSLRVRRRRVWARARTDATGRTVVELGGLARTDEVGFAEELRQLVGATRAALPPVEEGERA